MQSNTLAEHIGCSANKGGKKPMDKVSKQRLIVGATGMTLVVAMMGLMVLWQKLR